MNLSIKLKNFLRKIGFHKTGIWKFLKIFISEMNFLKVLHRLGSKKNSNAKLKILVINHFFDGEIEALLKQINNEDISIKYIYPEPTFTRAFVWFPSEIHNANIPYDSEEVKSIRLRFNDYCEKLFRKLRKSYEFDCIVTPSDSFFWIREFIRVAEKHGIPTIVADKEGTISPYDYLTAPSRIREFYPPIAKYFFVWSERQKTFWVNSGVSKENITIVGSIRTDSFINLQASTQKKSVLYFDFDVDAYINIFDWNFLRWSGYRSWGDLRDSFHRVIYKLAIKNPDFIFYIKCHPQQIVLNFPDYLSSLANVRIIKGAPKGIPSLLSQSVVVIGFQTTALLEASLTGVPVVYGAWGDLFDAVKPYLLPWHESGFGFSWARSEYELEKYALNFINNDCVNNEDRDRLKEYFYKSDGNVAARFLKEVNAIFEEQ
jgi:hypothetical protein